MKKTVLLLGTALLIPLVTACTSQTQQNTGTQSNNGSSATQTTQGTTTQETTTSSKANTTNTTNTTSADIKISVQQAVDAFTKEYPDTAVTSLNIEKQYQGNYFYSIEGVDDTTEYEARVDATSGDLTAGGTERLDSDEQNGIKKAEDMLDTTNVIEAQEAGEIAVKEAGGGSAEEWELDDSLGAMVWDVVVQNNNREYEVKINAETGDVMNLSQDD
ncbi:MAG: PepSY domain-containing protein [Enterococcus sp.]